MENAELTVRLFEGAALALSEAFSQESGTVTRQNLS